MTRGRRAVAVAVILVVAGVITVIQLNRIGQETASPLPADEPPSGIDVFYVRDAGNPHGLVAYDWNGIRRGSVRLPTWVEMSRLRPAPDGSGFLIDPSSPGDYAAYFDRGGRTLFETDYAGFFAQTWADDSVHVCVLTDQGVVTRLPGQSEHIATTSADGDYTVAACSIRTDTAVLISSRDVEVLRPSTGKLLARVTATSAVASTDAAYVAQPGAVYKTADLTRPAARLDSALQPLAFSGDDSLVLAGDPNGGLQAVAWRTGKVAWSYDMSGTKIDSVFPQPSDGDFVVYLGTGPLLIHRNGKTATFA